MKKLSLFLLLLVCAVAGKSQTIAVDPTGDGGFESGSGFTANGWTPVNATTNYWATGSGAGTSGGSNAAYITNDGTSYAYTITAAATSHFYRDIAIPAGATNITLSFQWKGMGQSGFDRLLVYTAPTSVTPVANMPASSNSTIAGATLRFTQPSFSVTTYTLATVSLPATLAGTTVRLIFTWQNNGSSGVSPGIAVDDISFSYCSLPAITGPSTVCIGSDITLANAETGGSWSSSTPAKGSINATTGVLTGLSAGNTTVTYMMPTGCYKTTVISVLAAPAAIGGTKSVCVGATTVLTNAVGGTWSSSIPAVATVTMTGVVTGVTSGTSTITYTNASGCYITDEVTVNPLPDPITGSFSVCIGSSTTLACSPTGGTWTSGTTAKATIGGSTGLLTGMSAGTSKISYTLPTGCRSTQIITVNILPGAITGTSLICVGSSVTMTNPTLGGTWSSSNTSIADVGSSTGVVTGTGTGTATISYTNTVGCFKTKEVTVNAAVPTISGSSSICTGTTQAYTNTMTGGTWSSSAAAIASIMVTSGVATGASAGTANITYTISAGCKATKPITVNATPAAIGGSSNVCEGGFTTTLTNTLSGGSWSSSNTSAGTIDAMTGQVTGILAGTTVITYMMPTGCYKTKAFTVNPTPGAITGSPIACIGSTTTLIPATLGGSSWSSSNTSVATVGLTSGVVTATTIGTTTITFTLTTGCYTTFEVTANPTPAAIVGPNAVCIGQTVNLTDTDPGGVWSSSNMGKATVGSSSGIVTGYAAGTTKISYTIAGCSATKTMTVSTLPSGISGSLITCVGGTTNLTIGTTGGTWSSSAPTVASVGTSGVVSGLSTGTAIISYTNAANCSSIVTVTVNAATPSITGSTSVCIGSTISLSIATTGGTWSSSATTKATVSSTGIVTGKSAGTTNITYKVTPTCYTIHTVTINALPATISGTLNVCVGQSTTVTNSTSGGSWSTASSILTIGSATGIVTGTTAGTALITYTLPTGCYKTAIFTVKPLPGLISGAAFTVCPGSTIALTNASTVGLSWTSSNTAVATIGIGTGIVTGVSAGTATMTYTLTTGCYTTRTILVHPSVSAIAGSLSECAGGTQTLTNADAGGTWTSSNAAIGTIDASTGVVTAIAGGTTTITYTLPTGCYATAVFTTNPLPVTIGGGVSSVCVGATATLTNATTGGTWASNNTSIATVGSASGVVSGVGTGVATISYILTSTGCYKTTTITVNPALSTISGASSVCTGANITLSNATSGGLWTSSNTSVASVVASSGMVTGVGTGTATITYTLGTGCYTTTTITVNLTPAAISGLSNVCEASNITLSSTTPSGVWSSTNTAAGTINSTTGVLTGIAQGPTTISYTLGGTCAATKSVSVHPLPSAITGAFLLCSGSYTVFSSATLGASWSSSNTAVGTIGVTSGGFSALSGGNSTITFTTTAGCYVTQAVTVVPAPPAIGGGTPQVCVGSTKTLTNAISGGTWSSSNTMVATVGSGTGVVSGLTVGTSEITYSLGTSCIVTVVVTVNPLPNSITGTLSVCESQNTTLSNSTSGGTWSSSNTGVATVGSSSGVVTGVLAGNTTISYIITATGCFSTANVTVNAQPASITGTLVLCEGNTTTLNNSVSGGVWSSSNTAVGTVNSSTGVVAGISAGNTNISYTIGTCFSVAVVTVNALPNSITGPSSVCKTQTITLSNTTSGGTWSSSLPGVASVNASTGVVLGVTVGNATITYTITATGCFRTTTVTVNELPVTTSGATAICEAATTTLTNATSGGTWQSSAAGVATVGSASGIVTGVSGGNVTISYVLTSTGCFITHDMTINPLPSAIGGTAQVCEGSTTTLTNSTPSGTWSSSTPAVGTVNSSTGVVTGISSGNTTITYTITATGCFQTTVVTVNPRPSAITGTATVCIGQTTALNSTPSGGAWSSSTPANGTIDAGTGVVTGIASGTTTITYTLPTGCLITRNVTVNSLPNSITGTQSVCVGSSTTLTSTTTGGTWSSSNTGIATIGSSGTPVTWNGVAQGNATMTYTGTNGCFTTTTVTVSALPGSITGTATVCVGYTTSLANSLSGGVWSSTNVAAGTINSSTGVVTGIAAGTTTISYAVSGCAVTRVVTVLAVPNNISGTASVCEGSTTSLSCVTSGGTWSSSNTSVATVGTGIGSPTVCTGIGNGNATVTYTGTNGCFALREVTVNQTPSAFTPSPEVCVGSTVTLASSPSGGTWTNNGSNASVGSATGIVTGSSAGTGSNITYTLSNGCRRIVQATVNALPNTITSSSQTVCVGSTITYSSTTPSGTWSSANTGIASVGSATGVVTGVAAGNTTITYTVTATGCSRTRTVTVNALPTGISGTLDICDGLTTTLTGAPSGGTWSSGTPGVATVGSATGLVTGVSAGTSNITYTHTGCFISSEFTVTAAPATITPTVSPTICVGFTSTLSNTTPGGTWTSSNTAVATVGSSTGIVTGISGVVSSGSVATITYTISTGCSVTRAVTVFPNPTSPIVSASGVFSACVWTAPPPDEFVTFTNASGSGLSWTSSNTAVGTISSGGGVFRGQSAGTTIITFTQNPFVGGCYTTQEVTVNAAPGAGTISGPITVIVANQITLSSSVGSGGTWTSGTPGVATIGSASGVVTGVSAGNTVVTYTYNNGCGSATATYTVSVTTSRPGGGTVYGGAENPASKADIVVFPNPNNGSFAVSGEWSKIQDEDISIEVRDMLGRIVYNGKLSTVNGNINHNVSLGGMLSNGMYLLILRSGDKNATIHFDVDK